MVVSRKWCVLGLALALAMTAGAQETERLKQAGAGIRTLQGWYDTEKGLWKTTDWWNAANSVTMLTDYMKVSGSREYVPVLERTFELNSSKQFLNDYYDDEGWWALAWAGAYEVTGEKKYLEMAETIFADMAKGWNETCGGGIWWKKPAQYKNAIANELFLTVAAKLASVSKDEAKKAEYLGWAKREWAWFQQTGMINGQMLVNDGLTNACQNNKRTTWSYNQGVILGGLTLLWQQTGEAKTLEAAQAIAVSAMARLTDTDGLLHDPCEPLKCGNDAPQFKGIFARHLAALHAAAPIPGITAFLNRNADSIWKNRDEEGRFGLVWSGPSELKTAATQTSALDALVAAARVEKK